MKTPRIFTIALTAVYLAASLALGLSLAEPRPDANGTVFRFSSHNEILERIRNSAQLAGYGYGLERVEAILDSESDEQKSKSDDSGYSTTNVQVAGIDEADVIKTDGSYLYVLQYGQLLILDVRDPSDIRQVFRKPLTDGEEAADAIALYLDTEQSILTVLSSQYETFEVYEEKQDVSEEETMPYRPIVSYTSAVVYDVSNPESPAQIRRFDQQGYYLDSRRAGDTLYVVTQKYADLYGDVTSDVLPAVREGSSDEAWSTLPAGRICSMPDTAGSSFITVSAVSTQDPSAAPVTEAVLGAGQTLYMSEDNLYVASAHQILMPLLEADTILPESEMTDRKTTLFRFDVRGGSVAAAASGTVPGTLINQFAMDEYDGTFRVATTTGAMWLTGEQASANNLYVLDSEMTIIGRLEGLGQNEQIKSVRFMGDRAYMVTFRTTDPLFAIDLSDPTQPVVTGELKIPGFSGYLHPVGDNLMIGFGQDAVEIQDNAFATGLKVSLFDTSDPENPEEISTLILGDRGSWSELLYNHKAMLSDPQNNIYGFPLTLAAVPQNMKGDPTAYGTTHFTGFIVLRVEDRELKTVGYVSHILGMDPDRTFATTADAEAFQKSLESSLYTFDIRRGLVIGDHLFTVSDQRVLASRLDTLDEAGRLDLG